MQASSGQAQRFVDGDEREDDVEFKEFRAELRFAWTAERANEAEHGKFHKRGRSAPCHSVRYLNFTRRSPEIRSCLFKDPIDHHCLG